MVTAAMELKDACSLEEKPRQCTKKQRHDFAYKGLYSQGYGFSSSHVRMWRLDHKEGWVQKNWCFQTNTVNEIEDSLVRHDKKDAAREIISKLEDKSIDII